MMKEVCDILSYNYKHIGFIDKKVVSFDCPLDLHCDYTTDVIMAALDTLMKKKSQLLEKVLSILRIRRQIYSL